MCGRYTVFDEESIIEMREIIRTVEASFSVAPADVQGCFAPDGSASFDVSPIKKGELAPKDTAPVLFPLPDGSGVTRGLNALGPEAFDNAARASLNQMSEFSSLLFRNMTAAETASTAKPRFPLGPGATAFRLTPRTN